jgi:hypothetical protein
MSNDRYNEDQMNGYNGPTHSSPLPSAEEQRLMAMTREQRRDYIDQIEHASAKAEHDAKEAALQAQIREATERSLAGNQWYQAQQRGLNNQRVTVQNGVMRTERLNDRSGNHQSDYSDFTAPAALVDTLPITVGGIQLGPDQAREMLARGEISEKAYYAGLDAALEPYGYKSSFNGARESGKAQGDEEADQDEDLDDNEKAAKAEQQLYEQAVKVTDMALNAWKEATPTDVQEAVVEQYIENGELDVEAAGVDAQTIEAVETGFIVHLEKSVLSHYGLSYTDWMAHVADEDMGAFRRAAIKGDWGTFHEHAQRCREVRNSLGL